MGELISRGHLFIAQPPLYKVSRRKQEVYLKDDGELSRFLLDRVADEFRLVLGSSGIDLAGEELRSALLACEDWHRTLASLERRGFPPDIVLAALDLTEGDEHAPGSAAYASALAAELSDLGYEGVRVELDEEHGVSEVVCGVGSNGRGWEVRLGRVLSDSGHFRRAKQQLAQIAPLRVGPYHLERNGDGRPSTLFAKPWLMSTGREASPIQRQGPRGMNPHQLWETTMARNRRLLQVTVETLRADELFTILMGAVEPRRRFIERRPRARNLDI
jgi:DNA gyrase subunit B